METLNLGIKFVKGWQDSTGGGTGVGSGSGIFSGSPQTGDLMLFIGLLLLGALVAGVCGFTYARNKKLCTANHINGGFVHMFNLTSFNITQKILIGVAGIVACSCIGLGIFGITAHADTNISSLISDKSVIETVVAKDGALTPDTCTITNNTTNKLALQSISVAIADTAKDVEGLKNSEITISTADGKTIYAGIPSGIPYNLSNFTLNPNASITLNFNFDNIDKDTAIALCDKNVFDISINTAKYYNVSATSDENGNCTSDKTEALEGETVTLTTTPNADYEFASWETQPSSLEITPIDASTHTFTMPAQDVVVKALFAASWKPMQAEIHDGTKIDFYPAFSDTNQIDGYKFATYDGTNYHEIQSITSMSNIYDALQPKSGTPTTTLYYQKTSSDAQALSCYTVKNLSWDTVFGSSVLPSGGEATAYDPGFIADYQQDNSGDPNGIKTALLEDDGFGSGWDVAIYESTDIPLVNGVQYANNSNTGFYDCYGEYDGGLLSDYSYWPWGCCARNRDDTFYFNVPDGCWYYDRRVSEDGGVVLARAFN